MPHLRFLPFFKVNSFLIDLQSIVIDNIIMYWKYGICGWIHEPFLFCFFEYHLSQMMSLLIIYLYYTLTKKIKYKNYTFWRHFYKKKCCLHIFRHHCMLQKYATIEASATRHLQLQIWQRVSELWSTCGETAT